VKPRRGEGQNGRLVCPLGLLVSRVVERRWGKAVKMLTGPSSLNIPNWEFDCLSKQTNYELFFD